MLAPAQTRVEEKTGRLTHVNDDNIFQFEEVEVPERSPHLVPWVVTGIIAVVVILAAVIALNVLRGPGGSAEETTEPAPKPAPTQTTTSQPTPKPTESTKPQNPDDEIDTSYVNVGSTFEMHIAQWGVTVDVSLKYGGDFQYEIRDGSKLMIDSTLVRSFPASCAAMRTGWGMERVDNGASFRVVSPQQECTENPSLYAEVLGLTRAMVESHR